MFRRKIVSLAAMAFAVLAIVLGGSAARAATPSNTGNGLRISPVRTDLTIAPGGSQTITVGIQNLTATTESLKGIVDDFTASKDETGTPYILLNGEKAPTHSLKDYVSSLGTVTLAPNEQKEVKVTVSIPKGVAGGGYYGAVRFAPNNTASDKNVTLTASVGSLILVKVPGDVKEQVNIASFDARKDNHASVFFTSNKSLTATVRFQNVGNIQEEPFGKILLKKDKTVLGTYEINNTQPRGNVLPDSIRKFSVPLHVGSFGKFTLEGNFGYGTTGQLLAAKTSFYVVPMAVIVLAIVIILLILFAIFGLPRLIRAYNRRVVRKATGRK